MIETKQKLSAVFGEIILQLGIRFGKHGKEIFTLLEKTEDELKIRSALWGISEGPPDEADVYFCKVVAMGVETLKRAIAYFENAINAEEIVDEK